MAAAEQAEKSHRQRGGNSRSPLGGVAYEAGEASLERFQSSDKDDRIRRFVARYRDEDREGRESQRDALTMDDFYTLLTFARRRMVAALRATDAAILRDGIDALAAIDQRRVDPRDLAWAAALVSWASPRVGLEPRVALREAADLASSETADILSEFADNPPDDLTDWGYRLVDRADGAALVRDDGNEYEPSVDLLAVATAVGAVFEQDAYERAEVTLGADVPDVWLRIGDEEAVARGLATVRAGASVNAELRPDVHRKAEDQMLVAFLVEVGENASAEVLAASASCRDGDALGVAAGRLCCVVIGHSVVMQTAAFETPGALGRFRDAIRRELERAQ